MIYKISHVGIGSAFRLGFLFGMVVTVAGVIFTVLVSLLGLSAVSNAYYGGSSGIGLISSAASIFGVVLSGFVGGAIASVIAGIVTAFYAWIYNIIAGGGNGLEITLDQSTYPEKVKFSG